MPLVLLSVAYCRPLDSAMAISAAMNAAPGDPPADSHRASRPEQDKVPPPGADMAALAAAAARGGREPWLW